MEVVTVTEARLLAVGSAVYLVPTVVTRELPHVGGSVLRNACLADYLLEAASQPLISFARNAATGRFLFFSLHIRN